ncbi:MAG: dTDP-4-dehydrorhamnose reductase [Bacteroidales bacterium]|nr:dTDP-4-dehydrorhamnose reductase [Bacteroidales bacterium]
MNILVTGANGQLGREMRIISQQSAHHFLFTDVNQVEGLETSYLDITDLNAVRQVVSDNQINAIVNCAAWTNVDAAEDPANHPIVERLNATAPENLAIAMHEVGGWIIQISTDYVFGQEPYNTPCREDQQGTPTGYYGLTKKMGEERIMKVFGATESDSASNGGYIIIRTAWLYSEFGKNFCKTMLNLTATKPALNVVFDQCGTPTYAFDLAQAILAILDQSTSAETNLSGIYHYSNEGVCSWFDFTKMIAHFSGHTACDVRPCHSCEFPSPVTRPSYSVLDKTKIKSTFGLTIPYWTDSLLRCIRNLEA